MVLQDKGLYYSLMVYTLCYTILYIFNKVVLIPNLTSSRYCTTEHLEDDPNSVFPASWDDPTKAGLH